MIKIKKLTPNALTPEIQTSGSAGADLHACIDEDVVIHPNTTVKIPTGIAIGIPKGYAGFIFARSGLATKEGLAPANKVGVIDSDYRGEVMVAIHNHSNEIRRISPRQRIAQIVIMPHLKPKFKVVDYLDDSKRADGGFGSTGS